MVQIGKFQCLSHRVFPEFFKTHPTLICWSIVQASGSHQTNRHCYLTALVNNRSENPNPHREKSLNCGQFHFLFQVSCDPRDNEAEFSCRECGQRMTWEAVSVSVIIIRTVHNNSG